MILHWGFRETIEEVILWFADLFDQEICIAISFPLNERQRDIWRKRKPANKKGGSGHPHQQTLQTSRLWLQFWGRSHQECKECYACRQPRGWKARPLKDLQDPHTLHPVTSSSIFTYPRSFQNLLPQHLILLLGGYDSPFHTLKALKIWTFIDDQLYVCAYRPWRWRHQDPPSHNGVWKKLQTPPIGSKSWTSMLQNPSSFEFCKFEEKASRLNGMPDQSSFDQMLVAVDSSCSCCSTLEFLLPGSVFGK